MYYVVQQATHHKKQDKKFALIRDEVAMWVSKHYTEQWHNGIYEKIFSICISRILPI